MSVKLFFASVIKAVAIATVAALTGILVFAFIVKVATLPSTAVKAVNQFIKAIAVFCGCFFALKESNGLARGAVVGVLFTVDIYLIFTLISGGLSVTEFWADAAFGLIVGAISGIVSVNVKAKNRG